MSAKTILRESDAKKIIDDLSLIVASQTGIDVGEKDVNLTVPVELYDRLGQHIRVLRLGKYSGP